MAPRNFSEDGAVGAGSLGGNFGTTNPTGGTTTTDSGMTPDRTGGSQFAQTQTGDSGFWGKMSPGSGAPQAISDSGGWGGGGLAPRAVGLSFKDGGAIPDGDDDDDTDPNATDPQGSALGQSMQTSINAAMKSVQDALSYGRKLHGLGGGQQEAAAMPSVPGNQSESGIPRERPMPGPLPPTANPFGKRADAGAIDDGSDQEAQVMPSVPFSESQRPQPMPGPLPPTSNPFGKRGQQADAGSDAAPDQAIDTEEEAA